MESFHQLSLDSCSEALLAQLNTSSLPSSSLAIMSNNTAPATASQLQTHATSDPDDEIVLRVGEQRFHTTQSTLINGSAFFAALFSGRWSTPQSDDGSYFLDANPKLFPYILAFLRREIYPILYDSQRGFDHALYQELRIEADYFLIHPLAEWIRQKSYLKTVQQEVSLKEITHDSDDDGETIFHTIRVEPNTEMTFDLSRGSREMYKCPRDISQHNDNFSSCGYKCRAAKEEVEKSGGSCMVQQSVVRVLIVSKKTTFVNP